MIWRFLPLIGLLLVLAIAGAWRPWLQRRRRGTCGMVSLRSKTPGQNLRDAMLVVLAVLLAGQAVAAAGSPEPAFPAWRSRFRRRVAAIRRSGTDVRRHRASGCGSARPRCVVADRN